MWLEEKILLLSKQNIERILNQNKEVKGFKNREIWKLAESKNNFIIMGLRKIGKTEFLHQIVKNRIKDSTKNQKKYFDENFKDDKSKILYLNLHDVQLLFFKKEIPLLIKTLIRKRKFELLLIDEIQVLDHWNYFVKDIVDTFQRQIQIYATSSNSNLLFNSGETGVGRFDARYFSVLSFEESKKINNKNNLESYIDFNHFPEYDLAKYKDEVLNSVIEKAFIDCNSRRDTLLKVLFQIVKNVGCATNLKTISKKSRVNNTHIKTYIDNLINSQLVFKIQNISKSNQNIKLYSLIPGLYNLFEGKNFSSLNKDEKENIFEQSIFIQILSKKTKLFERIMIEFYREKIDDKFYEINFIINNKLIEVKYSNKIDNLNDYIKIAVKLRKKELYFIYCGETKTQNQNEVKIQFINWKEINKHGF